jgi:hypothetical protein
MPTDKIGKFLEEVQSDPALQKEFADICKMSALRAADEMAKLSEEEKMPFTAQEFLAASAAAVKSGKELDDGELAAVAGGIDFGTIGAIAGGIVGGAGAIGLAVVSAPFVGVGGAVVGTGALVWSVVGGASAGSTIGSFVDVGVDLVKKLR